MTERGVVVKLDKKNRATVRFPRREACEHCNMCLKKKDEPHVEIVLANEQGAEVGQTVEVAMGARAVLAASFVAYIMPVVLVGIALVCTYRYNEILAFCVSIGVLIIAEILVALVDRKIRNKTEYMPRMTAIINTMEETDNE